MCIFKGTESFFLKKLSHSRYAAQTYYSLLFNCLDNKWNIRKSPSTAVANIFKNRIAANYFLGTSGYILI